MHEEKKKGYERFMSDISTSSFENETFSTPVKDKTEESTPT